MGALKVPSDPTFLFTDIRSEAQRGEFFMPHRKISPLFFLRPFQFSLSVFLPTPSLLCELMQRIPAHPVPLTGSQQAGAVPSVRPL